MRAALQRLLAVLHSGASNLLKRGRRDGVWPPEQIVPNPNTRWCDVVPALPASRPLSLNVFLSFFFFFSFSFFFFSFSSASSTHPPYRDVVKLCQAPHVVTSRLAADTSHIHFPCWNTRLHSSSRERACRSRPDSSTLQVSPRSSPACGLSTRPQEILKVPNLKPPPVGKY